MSCCYGNPLHHFSPESRSLIVDADDAGESDLARFRKWQTGRTLVTVDNLRWVSWPDGISTAYSSFEYWDSHHRKLLIVREKTGAKPQQWFLHEYISKLWAEENRHQHTCTCLNAQRCVDIITDIHGEVLWVINCCYAHLICYDLSCQMHPLWCKPLWK